MSRSQEELIALAKKSLLGNYKQPPFVLVKGRGVRVEDASGRSFLDLAGGIAVTSVGHAHPKIAAAVAAQASRLVHTSNLFYHEQSIELAAALLARTQVFSKVFFCNSGAEANEAMLKLARRFHHERGETKRRRLISTHGSFHGRTMGALTLTGQPKYHVGMEPLLGGVTHIEYGNIDALRAALSDDVAAVILEPIQAEGGLIVASDDYLRAARAACDSAGALLIFDEVQTGVGRTGKFLAREWSGVVPDACSLAKGIAGGIPLGAMLVTQKIENGLPPGSHATTFGGNPVACAAGLALLDVFDEEKVLDNVRTVGAHARTRLEQLASTVGSGLLDARGKGLLLGVKLAPGNDAQAMLAKLRDEGVLMTVAGADVIRISPALNITRPEIDEGIDALTRVMLEPTKSSRPPAPAAQPAR